MFLREPDEDGNARAAKKRKREKSENQVRVRSGSKGRNDTGLKHGSVRMKTEAKAPISAKIVS